MDDLIHVSGGYIDYDDHDYGKVLRTDADPEFLNVNNDGAAYSIQYEDGTVRNVVVTSKFDYDTRTFTDVTRMTDHLPNGGVNHTVVESTRPEFEFEQSVPTKIGTGNARSVAKTNADGTSSNVAISYDENGTFSGSLEECYDSNGFLYKEINADKTNGRIHDMIDIRYYDKNGYEDGESWEFTDENGKRVRNVFKDGIGQRYLDDKLTSEYSLGGIDGTDVEKIYNSDGTLVEIQYNSTNGDYTEKYNGNETVVEYKDDSGNIVATKKFVDGKLVESYTESHMTFYGEEYTFNANELNSVVGSMTNSGKALSSVLNAIAAKCNSVAGIVASEDSGLSSMLKKTAGICTSYEGKLTNNVSTICSEINAYISKVIQNEEGATTRLTQIDSELDDAISELRGI